ncbi:hypothetical protein ACF09C_00555 [Streptomyces sp. NPDC014870]|uniref:hypothetical protein n=1 Tax=Streptomyces sp. NPDC014870 TaxID=3364925 RepID=UPI0036F5791C
MREQDPVPCACALAVVAHLRVGESTADEVPVHAVRAALGDGPARRGELGVVHQVHVGGPQPVRKTPAPEVQGLVQVVVALPEYRRGGLQRSRGVLVQRERERLARCRVPEATGSFGQQRAELVGAACLPHPYAGCQLLVRREQGVLALDGRPQGLGDQTGFARVEAQAQQVGVARARRREARGGDEGVHGGRPGQRVRGAGSEGAALEQGQPDGGSEFVSRVPRLVEQAREQPLVDLGIVAQQEGALDRGFLATGAVLQPVVAAEHALPDVAVTGVDQRLGELHLV